VPREQETIKDVRYRDNLTEGYNITPNFFIRGSIDPEDIKDGRANYDIPRLTPERDPDDRRKEFFRINTHFENRLFDRDTLVLKSYNINFLFVLSAYVLQKDNKAFKETVKTTFRAHLIKTFKARYDFYTIVPKDATISGVESFVKKHFKLLIGKIYRGSDDDTTIWLALERSADNKALMKEIKLDAKVKPAVI